MNLNFPDKNLIAKSFSDKADTYNHYAHVQRGAIKKLAEYAKKINEKELWIDLGCGTGLFEEAYGPDSPRIVCLDIAELCLKKINNRANSQFPCTRGDIEYIPFKSGSFSAAIMASVLQWSTTPQKTLAGINCILKPSGQLLFSLFLDGSYFELNMVRKDFGMNSPVKFQTFPECEVLFDRSGFTFTNIEKLSPVTYYPSPLSALKSFVGTGSTAASGKRLDPHTLYSFCKEYDKRFRTSQGIPVSYNILVGTAVKTQNKN